MSPAAVAGPGPGGSHAQPDRDEPDEGSHEARDESIERRSILLAVSGVEFRDRERGLRTMTPDLFVEQRWFESSAAAGAVGLRAIVVGC
jgi:hypothetical protein